MGSQPGQEATPHVYTNLQQHRVPDPSGKDTVNTGFYPTDQQ